MENHPSLQYRRVWVKDERQVQTPVYNETAPNSTPSHVGALRSLKPTPWHPCPAAPRALVFPRTPCLSPFGVHQEEKGEIVEGKMRARREKESVISTKKTKKEEEEEDTKHLPLSHKNVPVCPELPSASSPEGKAQNRAELGHNTPGGILCPVGQK